MTENASPHVVPLLEAKMIGAKHERTNARRHEPKKWAVVGVQRYIAIGIRTFVCFVCLSEVVSQEAYWRVFRQCMRQADKRKCQTKQTTNIQQVGCANKAERERKNLNRLDIHTHISAH